MSFLDRLRGGLPRAILRPKSVLDEHTSYRDWRDYAISRLVRFALITTLLIAVMNFGFWRTHPFPERLVFWMASVAACLAVYEIMRYIVLNHVNPRWFGVEDFYTVTHIYIPLIVIPGAFPATLAMHALYDLLLARPDIETQPIYATYFQVVVIGIALGIVGNYLRLYFGIAGIKLYGSDTDREAALAPDTAETLPGFMTRVAPNRRGELIALQSEDHYLRVHTENGSDLIRYRLADAIAELPETAGRRVHRSWWVAVDAVQGGESEGRRAVLRTRTGLDIPVSRSYLDEVRKSGWL